MSLWTSVRGLIEVMPMGETQAEKRYILQTVLEHLPVVSGSESNMKVHMIQKDEETFFIIVEGELRDRNFKTTFKEINKWLNRLSKRVLVNNVQVVITGYVFENTWKAKTFAIVDTDYGVYSEMFEPPFNREHPNWCGHLLSNEHST